jgi:hypothetical protein
MLLEFVALRGRQFVQYVFFHRMALNGFVMIHTF